MDSWLAENGSRAAAVLHTVLGHLDTAYTGAVFIGMVPMVIVLCICQHCASPACRCHMQSSGIMVCRRLQLKRASRH